MKITYEILNDGAFVVTKIDNELLFGFYHDVYNGDSKERIFEPLAPVNVFSHEEIFELLKTAK